MPAFKIMVADLRELGKPDARGRSAHFLEELGDAVAHAVIVPQVVLFVLSF